MGIRRAAGVLAGVVLVAGCGAAPATSAPSHVPAPFSLARVPDQPSLMGDAVGRPSLVVLPDGTNLMLRNEDVSDGGELLRSADGRDWSPVERTDIGLDAAWLGQLVQSDAAIVALGTAEERTGNGGTDPDMVAWVSAEGTTWTPLAGADAFEFAHFAPGEVIGSPAGFAALTYDGSATILLGGPDGRGWRRTIVPAAVGLHWSPTALAPAGDGWIAVGAMRGGSAAWRWRGATWERLPLQTAAFLSNVEVVGKRIVVTGYLELADVEHPDAEPARHAVAWESLDDGATWADTGLDLTNQVSVGILPLAGGFLAVSMQTTGCPQRRCSGRRSQASGAPVPFEEGGEGFDRPYVSLVVQRGHHVVVAGNTVGTGAGGDRVVVWTGEIAGS